MTTKRKVVRRITPEEKSQVLKLAKEGYNSREIEELTKVPASLSCYHIAKFKNGGNSPWGTKRSNEKEIDVARLQMKNEILQEMLEKFMTR